MHFFMLFIHNRRMRNAAQRQKWESDENLRFFFSIVFRRLTLMTCMTNIWLTLEHFVARRMRRRKIILNLTMKFLCKLFACFIWFLSRSAPVSCGALGLRIFEAAWQSARIWLGGGRNIKTNYDEWSINSVNLLTKLSKNGRMLQITMTIAKIELSHAIVNRRIKTCASVCCEVGASTQFHGRYEIELDQVSCVDRSSKLTAIVSHRLSSLCSHLRCLLLLMSHSLLIFNIYTTH